MRKNRIRVLNKAKAPQEPETGSRFDRSKKSDQDDPIFPPELLRELFNRSPVEIPGPVKPEKPADPPKAQPEPVAEAPLKTARNGQPLFRTAVLRIPADQPDNPHTRVAFAQDEPSPVPPARPPADIIISQTPSGLMIVSSDIEALDDLERLINRLVGPEPLTAEREYAVYYLKFAKAEVAGALLQEILTGSSGDSGGGGGMGGLMGGLAGAALGGGGDLMGSLMGLAGGGGGGFSTQGEVSIISDARLNALVIQAVPDDLDMIEELLEIIDKEKSPENVQVVAKPRMIPVKYMQAQEVATIVQQVFAAQMSGGGGSAQRGPSPEDFIRALRGGGGGRSKPKQEEPKISIGVDTRSNSLVVSAPDSLFEQVKALVEQLDKVGADSSQTTQVLSLRRASPAVIQQALSSMIEGEIQSRGSSTRRTTSTGGSSTSRAPTSGSSSQAAQTARMMQGIQMMRSMQGSSGGGRPTGGRPTGGRPTGSMGGRGGFSGRGR